MCLYQLRFVKPIKEFYCGKLKDVLLACPPSCGYYVPHPTGSIDDISQEINCINLDFMQIVDEKIPICLQDGKNFPDCSCCPPEKKILAQIMR